MSVAVTSWVWKYSTASATELLVMLALADQADDDGMSWPSIAYLARKTRVHQDTVRRALRDLIRDGQISREERIGHSNVYRVLMQHPPAICTPPQITGGSIAPPTPLQSAPPPPRNSPPPPPRNSPPHNHQRTTKEPSGNRQTAKRGTRLSADWMPDEPLITSLRSEIPHRDDAWWRREHTKFVDYWCAKAGQSATKLDWNATFRNWCRTADDRAGGSPATPTRVPTTTQRFQQGQALTAKYLAMEAEAEQDASNVTPLALGRGRS